MSKDNLDRAELTALAECRAECERLKYLLDLGHSGLIQELQATQAENGRLRAALVEATTEIEGIMTSRKGSIGSVDNVYLPQLNRKRIDDLYIRIKEALNED